MEQIGQIELLTAEEVAPLLDCKVGKVYELARKDMIPHIKIGRNVRFLEDEIIKWLRAGGTKNSEAI